MDDNPDVINLLTMEEAPMNAADQPSTAGTGANGPASFIAAAAALAAMGDALRDAERGTPTPWAPGPNRRWPP